MVHAEVLDSTKREILGHYLDVVDTLFKQLKEKGVTEVEAWVTTEEEIKYAQFFGFDEFIGELTINQQTLLPPVYRLRKRLT